MRQALEAPVEYGDTLLAPTTELAGLAELSQITDGDERLDVIARIAAQIKAEDQAREFVRAQRRAAREGNVELPKRQLA